MRVFPDTNVLVSALVARGLCEDLLRLLVRWQVRGRLELVIGVPVAEELERILKEKLNADRQTLLLARALLAQGQSALRADRPAASAVPDPDGIPIVANAIAAGADLFVTGDKALLQMGEIEGMAIVWPRECWTRLTRLR